MSTTLHSSNVSENVWDTDHTLNPSFTPGWFQTDSVSVGHNNDVSVNHSEEGMLNCRIVSRQFAFIPWSNPSNIITRETVYLIAKVVDGVLSALMAFVGMPLNILNCLVFFKQGLRDRINLLLFSQGLVDFLVEVKVLLQSIEYVYTLLAGNFQLYGPWMRFMSKNGLHVLYGFVYVSGFTSTMIACERCLCTTFPLKVKKLIKSSTATVTIGVAALILVGGHYVIGEKYQIGCIHYMQSNLTVTGYIPSQFYLQHKNAVDIVSGLFYGFGLPCFFVLTTVITTMVTSVKLRTAAAWRQQRSSVDQTDRSEVVVTKMLIVLSCWFVACTLPGIVIRLVHMFVSDFTLGGRYQNLYMGCVGLMHVIPATNSGLNFFFYLRMGSKFRQTLKQLCCRLQKMSAHKRKGRCNIKQLQSPLVQIG